MSEPQTIVILTTGGTIACTHDPHGGLIPTRSGNDLLLELREHWEQPDIHLRVKELGCFDSSSLSFADLDDIRAACRAELADPNVAAIIITHGTDSLEETAIALDACHHDPRPIILTGAMRPADDPHPDGPGNLRDAARIAADPTSRDLGVLVVFGKRVLPARGTVKRNTTDTDAFAYLGPEQPLRPEPLPPVPLAHTRVDIICAYPGAPRTLVDAAIAQGAQGIVVEAMGAGNVGAELAAALIDALAVGIAVVISTRVAEGPIHLTYGGAGGGTTLAASGALSAHWLRAGQARILLALALATGRHPATLL